jgi:phenylacetic acid degradation operon negative regulatory protein
MASLLLGRARPEATARDLVRWCALFGVSEGTARVALHRMVAKGELVAGEGRYRLSGRLERRRGEQERSLQPRTSGWEGSWITAVMTGERSGPRDRAHRRDRLRRAHYAELREGIWTRPDNLGRPALTGVQWWHASPDAEPAPLAMRLFRLRAWQRRGAQLVERAERATAALAHGDDGLVADAFVTGALTLRHIHSDPLLPAALLPEDWPASDLRAAYGSFQRAFGAAAAAWFRRA